MRVFTDGSCTANGKPGAKAGFAAWFPEHREWSSAHRVPDGESQTNQRAELSGIALAVRTLEEQGCHDEDIVIYTDSDYCINCLTKWISGWIARGWKTTEGKDVLHRDLIERIANGLSRFKSHRFHHVRSHTGNTDDLSVNNDIVDRMARGTVEEVVRQVVPPTIDELFPQCPLRLMGPPVSHAELMRWIRANMESLDADVINKHLFKAFTELCKTRDVTLTKQVISKQSVIRAERNLQVNHVQIEKVDE
jgi:ribonuclease HI